MGTPSDVGSMKGEDRMEKRNKTLKAFVWNLFTSGMGDEHDIETTRKVILSNILVTVGVLLLVPYAIVSFYNGAYVMSIIDILIAFILALSALYLRITHNYSFASFFGVSTIGVFFLFLIISGGINNTGYLWSYAFPLLAVFLFGARKGSVALFLFFSGILFFFAFDFPPSSSKYSLDFKVRFISSLFTISLFAYIHVQIRVAFQKEITRKNEELSKIQRLESLGLLAGGIAHDFNNILTGVMGNLALLETSIDKDSENYALVTKAKQAAERTQGLTRQLMTFSKGGAPVRETAFLEELLREVTELSLHGSKTKPEYYFSEDLLSVDIDKGQIGQVVQNLVLNADNAMPEGGVLKISATHIDIADIDPLPLEARLYVKVSIEDEGVGIPENMLQDIFNPYFTTKQEGHGLGLTISYSIISRHGGHITVAS